MNPRHELPDPGDTFPRHDEARARREFTLRTADEAREYARERLRNFLLEHPGVLPTPRREP